MNKAALKTLVVEGLPKFFPNKVTFSEDTMVARIFREFGVYPYETKDENGSERYMPFMPGHHYGYRMPVNHAQDWYARYSINILEGTFVCKSCVVSPLNELSANTVLATSLVRCGTLLSTQCGLSLRQGSGSETTICTVIQEVPGRYFNLLVRCLHLGEQ
jgi:hypothetical protein